MIFGVVPKTLWSRHVAADEQNRIPLAFNCCLIRAGEQTILVETGGGDKMDARARERMKLPPEPEPLPGIVAETIDIVINTHLHWDHCGGNTILKEEGAVAAFPRARYFAPRGEWEHAQRRLARDSVSYIDANYVPLIESGQMTLTDGDYEVAPGIWMRHAPGHTHHMTIVTAESGGQTFCFLSDLVPMAAHLTPTWVTSFDLDPVETIEQKQRWLSLAAERNWLCSFAHEMEVDFTRITRDRKRGFCATGAPAVSSVPDGAAPVADRYRLLFENSPFPMWEEDFSEVKRFIDQLRASGAGDLRAHFTQNRADLESCQSRIRVLDVNRAARDFYGATDKQQLLAGWNEFFDETAWEIFREEMATLAENNSMFRAEFPVRTLAGEERRVNMTVTIMDTSATDWSRVVVSFFDVTERKRVEDQAVQARKLESLGRLAGGIAHDFNNLLTVINGYSEWMLRQMPPDDTLRPGVVEIQKAGARGAELTQQLLAFSRKQVVRPAALDINALILESEAMLRRVIGEDIDFRLDLARDSAVVKVDRTQMHQVLMNLAINGREAMPDGGSLTIATRNVVCGPQANPMVLIEVRDTGTGIDERTKQHIFEPFYTTKRGSKGTGLGLATVFGIVTQAGGEIDVTSCVGEGSTFRVRLPRIDGRQAPSAARTEEEGQYRGFGTVLVVEDQEEVRRLACQIVEELGFQVLSAANGQEALATVAQISAPIRLLLTDVVMPGMDGGELAERITAAQPEMRVIFMSGYPGQVLGGLNRISRPISFLQKPFTRARLIGLLRTVLP